MAGTQHKPVISVITVVYNGVKQFEETINSVLNQTFTGYEIVVIDGGSNDGTVDLIRKYESRIGYWISEPDKGLYDAMNKGIKAAKGDFLYFLNVGDTLFNENVLLEIFGNPRYESYDLIYGKAITKNDPLGFNHVFGGEITLENFYFNVAPICHQASFIRKRAFDEIGDYDTSYRLFADMDWFIRYFSRPDFKSLFVDKIIAGYETEGVSYHNRYISLKENLKSSRKNFPFFINLLKHLNYPVLWTKVTLIRLLKETSVYKAYKRMAKRGRIA